MDEISEPKKTSVIKAVKRSEPTQQKSIKVNEQNITTKKEGIKNKRQSLNTKQIMFIVSGVISLVLGIFVFSLYMANNDSPLLAAIAFACISGGVYLIYKSFNNHEANIPVAADGKIIQKQVTKANTMNITAYVDQWSREVMPDQIYFSWEEEHFGKLWQSLDNGEYFFVRILDIATKKFMPWRLPDAKFVDPAIAGLYLELPAQRQYFKYRESLLKYLSYGVLGVMVAIGFIAIIAIGG